MMTYWTLKPPKQWQAGLVGADQTPIYFSCADCHTPAPPIAGILSTDGTFAGIGILRCADGPFRRPAMFCTACLATRLGTDHQQGGEQP